MIALLAAGAGEARSVAGGGVAAAAGNGQIAAVSLFEASSGAQRLGIYRVNPDGSNRRRITTGSHDRDPSWSPDGKSIVFSRVERPGPVPRLYVASSDGTRIRRLTGGSTADERPAWAPSGNLIAFERSVQRDRHTIRTLGIWVVRSDGRGLKRLTKPGPLAPAWAPHGHEIAYSERGKLFVMESAGGNPRRLTNPPGLVGDSEPDWSPDGRWIAFIRTDLREPLLTYKVLVVSSDGTEERAISIGKPLEATDELRDPTWSPDGSSIAFLSVPHGIVVTPRGGGRARVVLDGIYAGPDWGRTPSA